MHHLRPVDELLAHLDPITVKMESEGKIKNGQVLSGDDFSGEIASIERAGMIYRIHAADGRFLGLGKSKGETGGIIPFKPWVIDQGFHNGSI
jgi:hypothetical protein